MSSSGDYYEILGVARDADAESIKSAFRRLAHRYHPDVSTEPDAEQRFREIAEAYGVLSDPAKRASYDSQGSAVLAGTTAEDLWTGIDFTDLFGSRAATFGDLYERLFGPSAARPVPGEDVRQDLSVTLDEVMTGADHVVTIRRPSVCPRCAGRGSSAATRPRRCEHCGGTGQRTIASRHGPLLLGQLATCPECGGTGHVIDEPCPTCQGTGWAMGTERVTIRVPPGIPEGATLRVSGKGMPSPVRGGSAGDLYLSIRTQPGSLYRRVGADLWHDVHLQAYDAALGVTAAVSLPGGQTRVRIPPGTQPGSVLRVGGHGLPRYDREGRGDLHLTVVIDIPRQLTPAQRLLYEQLRGGAAPSAVAGHLSTSSRSSEPANPPPGLEPAAGPAAAGGRGGRPVLAPALLLITGVANVVVGIATITSSGLLLGDAASSTWGWIMIMVGVVGLLGAVAAWGGRRAHG